MDPLTADRQALSEPRRVSPFAPIFLAWAVIRQLGYINIGIFTAVVGSGNLQLIGLAASVALLGAGVLTWWRFTYSLETPDEGDQLVTNSGVFSRTRTSVPLDRVQSVSTRQNLLHRVVNLVEVNVQTAGSAGAEIKLTAVRPLVAERIRRLSTVTTTSGTVDTAHEPAADPDTPPVAAEPLLRRSFSDIIVVALTRNPLVLIAPIPLLAGLGFEAEDLLARLPGEVGDSLENIGGSVAGVVALVVLVLALSALLAIAFVVLRLHDLRLFVDGAGLRRQSGLISRTEVTASVERVQVMAVSANPLERMLGQREVVLPVAGGAATQVAGGLATGIQLPGTRLDEVREITAVVLGAGQESPEGVHDLGISRLAVRRWTFWLGVAPVVVAIAATWWLIGAWSLFAVAWIPVVLGGARLRQSTWRWSLQPETLWIRNGVITKVTRQMPVRKTQNVALRQSFFHRRNGLADVRVRTASRVQMIVPMLPLAQAQALRDELLYRSESDPRPFM